MGCCHIVELANTVYNIIKNKNHYENGQYILKEKLSDQEIIDIYKLAAMIFRSAKDVYMNTCTILK